MNYRKMLGGAELLRTLVLVGGTRSPRVSKHQICGDPSRSTPLCSASTQFNVATDPFLNQEEDSHPREAWLTTAEVSISTAASRGAEQQRRDLSGH